MKKIIFSKKSLSKESILNYSVVELAKFLSLPLTYNQYYSISDQEIEFWENIPEPWNIDEQNFKLLFIKYFRGDKIV